MNHFSIVLFRFLRFFLIYILILANTAYAGSDQFWTDVATTSQKANNDATYQTDLNNQISSRRPPLSVKPLLNDSFAVDALLPDQFRLLKFDEKSKRNELTRNNKVSSKSSHLESLKPLPIPLSVPLPDGGFITLNMVGSDVMAPGLAVKHPQIKTYRVDGIDNKGIYGAVDFTAQGFHAMLFMPDGTRVFIDPRVRSEKSGKERVYISYYKKHYHPVGKEPFKCSVPSHNHSKKSSLDFSRAARKISHRSGEQLKTYRLAMSATSEYTAVFGSKAAALGAITTTVSRVNVIYQRDLAVKLQLVENTDKLIQINTSVFTNDNDDAMLTENQRAVDSVIGSNNYDIGHVVSTGGGGLATLGALCDENVKAEGVTGSPQPVGDTFDIDFVAHEIGHQFGATHTFNSETENCSGENRSAETAFEPGSGSTIMAYAGICGAKNNTQNSSDAMFHITSIVQIGDYIETGDGSVCGVSSTLDNKQPLADAGSDFTIPANTPFELTGSASDPDKDTLTYSWEQIDAGTASDIDDVESDNAIFRAFLPTSDATRVIPTLPKLLSNSTSKGETLPTLARELNFSFVVRDGKGGVAADEMKVTVSNSAAFKITSHNTLDTLTLRGNSTSNVAWDVGSTNSAPINCSQVDIQLSTNAASSFITLLAGTPNDGFASVPIPASINASTKARFKVTCADNIFFDISDADLTVESLLDALPSAFANLGSNNVADPGETIQLTIPLRNNSSAIASSVSGTLASSASGAGITVADSSYPNIQPSNQGDNTTAYEVKIPVDHECGVEFPLTLTTDFTIASQAGTGTASTKVFNVNIPTGTASVQSETNATITNIPDDDPTGISSQVMVTGIGRINQPGINIDIDIDHEYRGDVVLSLTSPQGTTVQLKELFIDEGKDVKGNFPKTLSPTASLRVFDGENLDGIWMLKVFDNNEEDTGTLNSWALNFTHFICDIPDVKPVELPVPPVPVPLPANTKPVATDSNILVAQDQAVNGILNASDADSDALTYAIVSNASQGTVKLDNATTGAYTYTPDVGKIGQDSFTFRANDGTDDSGLATVNITINAVASEPSIEPEIVAVNNLGNNLTPTNSNPDSNPDSNPPAPNSSASATSSRGGGGSFAWFIPVLLLGLVSISRRNDWIRTRAENLINN